MSSNSSSPRGPAPDLPVFRPSAHVHHDHIVSSTNKSSGAELGELGNPLLDDSPTKSSDTTVKSSQNGGREVKKGKGRCCACCTVTLAIMVTSLVLNVLLAATIVVGYMVFSFSSGGGGDCPPVPPAPGPVGRNFTCSIPQDTREGDPQFVIGENDTSSVDFCWYFPQFGNDTDQVRYSVFMDHWYTQVGTPSIPVLKNATAVETLEIQNLLAGVPYQFQVLAESLAPGGGGTGEIIRTDVVTIATAESHGCGNRYDMDVYRNANPTALKETLRSCIVGNLAKANETRDCIVEQTSLSASCSVCWVPNMQCIINTCLSKGCLNPKSDKCMACVQDHCMPGLADCGGQPDWFFDFVKHAVFGPTTSVVNATAAAAATANNNTADWATVFGLGSPTKYPAAARVVTIAGEYELAFFAS